MSNSGEFNVPNPEKKVDESWKAEIEKERIAEEEIKKQSAPKKTGSQEHPPSQDSNEDASDMGFTNFLSTLAMQAYIALGQMENPVNGQKEVSLPQAKYMIDVIEVIQKKTKGNLNPQEENMISTLLYELRVKYVELSEDEE